MADGEFSYSAVGPRGKRRRHRSRSSRTREGEQATIAPNTRVEIKGQNLARANDTRTWASSDFVNSQLPTSLDGTSVTVNGKAAYLRYIGATRVDILTPPDAMSGPVNVW